MKKNEFELDTEMLSVYLFGGIVDDIGTLRDPIEIFDYEGAEALADGIRELEQIQEHIEYALGNGETFDYYDESYNFDNYEVPDEQIKILTATFFSTVSDNTAEQTYIELDDLEGKGDPINQTDDIDIVAHMKATLDEDEYTSYDGSANKVA
jgi:hypothetical protein